MLRVIGALFFINYSYIFACNVDDRIMFSIAEIEKHKDRVVGYPYLISFNSRKDIDKLNIDIKKYFIDSRTIDCQNVDTCKYILSILILNNIKNLDCGAFQINYKFWKIPNTDYFDIKKSYAKACSIVESHNKLKWSWNNIANYHSGTPHLNRKYKSLLLSSIQRNINN